MVRRTPPAWLWMVPVFTLGVLSIVGPLAVAHKSGYKKAWFWSIFSALLTILGILLMMNDADNEMLGHLGLLTLFLNIALSVTFTYTVGVGLDWGESFLYRLSKFSDGIEASEQNKDALTSARQQQKHRLDALDLIKNDPQLAIDLNIGRPDLQREFQDGGLVDINNVSASVFHEHLGIDRSQAEHIVQVRAYLGRFQNLEDLVALAGLDTNIYERIRHRLIII